MFGLCTFLLRGNVATVVLHEMSLGGEYLQNVAQFNCHEALAYFEPLSDEEHYSQRPKTERWDFGERRKPDRSIYRSSDFGR